MNEITIHGNVVSDPETTATPRGATVLKFRVALNRRRFDREKNRWMDLPAVFQQVVAFNQLAENAAATLAKGTTVTLTGELVDDSYTPAGARYSVQRTVFYAADIAVSLRWATAQVTKTASRSQADQADRVAEDAAPVTEQAEEKQVA